MGLCVGSNGRLLHQMAVYIHRSLLKGRVIDELTKGLQI